MCHCIFFGINPCVSKYHAFIVYRATHGGWVAPVHAGKHPQDQKQTPPGTKGRHLPDQKQTPPGPKADTPPRDQKQTPPGPKADTSPGIRLLLRTVRILLECSLVLNKFAKCEESLVDSGHPPIPTPYHPVTGLPIKLPLTHQSYVVNNRNRLLDCVVFTDSSLYGNYFNITLIKHATCYVTNYTSSK